MEYTDKELLKLLKENREEGAAALMEQYTGLLWSVCARRLSDAEDIRECVNMTFAKFCLHLERYSSDECSLKNYLCLMADTQTSWKRLVYSLEYELIQTQEIAFCTSRISSNFVYGPDIVAEESAVVGGGAGIRDDAIEVYVDLREDVVPVELSFYLHNPVYLLKEKFTAEVPVINSLKK